MRAILSALSVFVVLLVGKFWLDASFESIAPIDEPSAERPPSSTVLPPAQTAYAEESRASLQLSTALDARDAKTAVSLEEEAIDISQVKVPTFDLPIYFYDGCWDSNADKPAVALQNCRQLRKKGERWQRLNCRCKAADLIVFDKDTPLALYTTTVSNDYAIS